ncbi:putative acetyltransferase like [Capsicum annuum]|uniref:uncharacterized acetyltransferase At3g50280-like n=1 Tax=Capsicum annuum TaxID=4072 RepID=UPI001FB0C7E9|nr:uncharacterized acetyltransferase At3g50280-like [Capsicum annuum]
MEEVQVISRMLIAAENEVANKQHIDLTPWDLRFPLLGTIQKGLFFHKPTPQQQQQIFKSSKSGCFIDHLKTSLAKTLQFFPPLVGRLATTVNVDKQSTSFFIDCNNAGAQFVHAVAPSTTMACILESTYVPCVVPSFFPLNGIRNSEGISTPLLGVQVTELADGYFIGCTLNHMAGDGGCFWHFFNSWSEISRGFGKITRLPDLQRWFPTEKKSTSTVVPVEVPLMLDDKMLLDDELKIKRPVLKERVFHFSSESIATLKAKANSELRIANTNTNTNISSLQAFLAHLWLSVTRARCLDEKEEVAISLIIGTRSRIEPPLSETYFGNAAYLMPVKANAGELLEKGIGWAALAMNKMVASQDYVQVLNNYKEWLENPLIYNKSTVFVGYRLGISSSPRFNVYGTDFGWGKPVAVRSGMANKGDGKVTIFSGVEEGSFDIELCLLPETLEALGKDEEFMEVVSV